MQTMVLNSSTEYSAWNKYNLVYVVIARTPGIGPNMLALAWSLFAYEHIPVIHM